VEQGVVVLDGRHSESFKKQLYTRLKYILDFAIKEKESGEGLFARPEVDAGLFCLLNSLERLEPGIGWRHKAIVTAINSIDTALKMKDKWWWPRYEEAIREHRFELSEGGFGLNYGIIDQYIQEPFREHAKKRFQISENLSQRYAADIKAKWEPVNIDPLPAGFPRPLWENKSVPEFPENNKSAVSKYGSLIANAVWRILDKPLWDGHYIAMCLGDFSEQEKPEAWGGLSQHYISHYSLLADHDFHYFAGIPILQRFFGGTTAAVLDSLNAHIGVLKHYSDWREEPYSFESAMGALLVNNTSFLDNWVRRVKKYKARWNPNKVFNILLLRFLESPADATYPDVKPLKGKYLYAYQQAFIGLMTRDCVLLDESVLEMLKQWPKVQDGIWVGYEKYNYCIPAMAIQRTALRLGMEISIPDVPSNDPELVLAEDPQRAFSPYCTIPGADLVADSTTVQWPSLYLNEPVNQVVELEEKTFWVHPDIQTFSGDIEGAIQAKLKVRVPGGVKTNMIPFGNTAIAGRGLDSSYGITTPSICVYYTNLWEPKWVRDVSFTPEGIVFEDDTVFVTTSDLFSPGYIYAIDAASGEEKWQRRLKGEGFNCHPVIIDDLIVVATRRCICAYGKRDGKLQWEYDELQPTTKIMSNGNVVCFGTDGTMSSLCALDSMTGKQVWYQTIGKKRIIAIAISDECVYAASLDENLCHIDLNNGTIKHRSKERIGSNVLIKEGIVYSVLLCDDADIQTLGAFDLSTDVNKWICDPRVLDDELNYVGNLWGIWGSRLYSGALGLNALDFETGQVVWNIRSENSDPVIPVCYDNGDLYVIHKNDLWVLDESEGLC
jgi:outer membrane protein assembly factor BamB